MCVILCVCVCVCVCVCERERELFFGMCVWRGGGGMSNAVVIAFYF